MPFATTFAVSSFVMAIIAIVFGIIMLVKPQIVAYLIGIYLIIIGAMFFIQNYLM